MVWVLDVFMTGEYSLEDGKELVKLARKSISYTLASGARLGDATEKKRFQEKRGCFVTLNTFPEKELRGCIGFPAPTKSLWSAVIDAAASAALRDPRFPQMKSSELEKVLVEISILTVPEEIKAKKSDVTLEIDVGKDGLIVSKGGKSGLLLPQVPEDFGWDAETFLKQGCIKAGLPPIAWREPGCRLFKFQAQIFSEKEPKGEVIEH
jgi:hypothetical protein